MRALNSWRRSASGHSICDSGNQCGLWSRRYSLLGFTYLFFGLPWPVPVLQTVIVLTGMTCTWAAVFLTDVACFLPTEVHPSETSGTAAGGDDSV